MASYVASQSITRKILAFMLLFFSLQAFSLPVNYRSSSLTPAPGTKGSAYAKFTLESSERCTEGGRIGLRVNFAIEHADYDPVTWHTEAGVQGLMYTGWQSAPVPAGANGLSISPTSENKGLIATVSDRRPGSLRVRLENCSVIPNSTTPLVGDSIQFSFNVTADRQWMSPVINLHYLNDTIKMWESPSSSEGEEE